MAYALVELTIEFRLWHLYHDCLADIYYSADRLFHPQIFFFDLNILKNESRLAQALRPFFSNLQLNTETDNYRRLIHDLSQDGLRMSQWAFNQGFHGIVLPLISQIEACVVEHNSDDWFYSDEYAMIPATESSINLMLNKVRVEAEAEVEDCCICLEELKVGSDAAQMPCAHVFHADCIEKWLYTSHYCPICSLLPTLDSTGWIPKSVVSRLPSPKPTLQLLKQTISRDIASVSVIFDELALARERLGISTALLFDLLIRACCEMKRVDEGGKKRLEEASETFEKMKEMGLVPGAVTYRILIHGYCNEGDLEKALGYRDEMIEQGISPTVTTYNMLIHALFS
ncbi:hypothetical protein V6N12_005877 [Hibiscus sabdariffa]|uniref:RING-type domain-containing protein n=1 Tax=Hibiscus sabdariffa TaxID=183260 RepID=A0ABR2EXN8_9ROSI